MCDCACALKGWLVHAGNTASNVKYLIPGSVGEHASKEGVHVAGIHGLAVLLDALCITKDQALPEQRIALPEPICDLPVGGQSLRYGE